MTNTTIASQEESLADLAEERNVLACVLRSQEAWLKISNSIVIEDFTHTTSQALWTVVDALREGGATPSPVSVMDKLPPEIKQRIEAMGGWDYIQRLSQMPVDPTDVERHAKSLRELTILRRGREAGYLISKLAEKGGSSELFLQKVEEIVNDIPGEASVDVSILGSIAESFIAEKRANPKKIAGLKTNYAILDSTIQGLQPSRLYILGARTGQGKSVWCLNLVKNLAVDQEIPVLYISTEQTQRDEISRLISIVGNTPEQYIDNGTFISMNSYPEQVDAAEQRVKHAPIWFSHDPFFTSEKLYRTIKKFVITEGVKAVFFDYIRIPVSGIGSRDKWALVGDLAYGLKACASELNVPVISAVQVNRDGAEQFTNTGEIDGSSFALSDMIEQASSVAMILRPLNREERKEHQDYAQKRVLTFSKNRHGSSREKILFRMESQYVKLSEVKSLAQ